MARLRIAFFGSSTAFSAGVLAALAANHEVVAAVRPSWPGLRRMARDIARIGPPAPLEARARDLGIPVLNASGMDEKFCERLRALRLDLVAIALFPRRVPIEVTRLAVLGAVNVHPSLLPRHRGPLPLFWTYHAGDRLAGVTVHHATERVDAGDIILQDAFELPRGYPVSRLDHDVASRAALLADRAVDAIARATATRTPQDEAAASYAPVVQPGVPMVAFDAWDVEQVWHFLAGLCPPYHEPLVDAARQPVEYSAVAGYSRCDPDREPGRVERRGEKLLLHCRGGIVELA